MCHSSKEAETKNVLKLVDEAMYQARMMEEVLFDGKKKVKIDLYTDSKPLMDSIASTKQVEQKMMRPIINNMKDKLTDYEIRSFRWLETKKMVADILTKEKMTNRDIDEIMYNNEYEGIGERKDRVVFNGVEIKLECVASGAGEFTTD